MAEENQVEQTTETKEEEAPQVQETPQAQTFTQDEVNNHATQNGAVPGDIRFVDVNGDGIVNDNDRTQIGDPFPDFTIGWNLNLDYKAFDLSIFKLYTALLFFNLKSCC